MQDSVGPKVSHEELLGAIKNDSDGIGKRLEELCDEFVKNLSHFSKHIDQLCKKSLLSGELFFSNTLKHK